MRLVSQSLVEKFVITQVSDPGKLVFKVDQLLRYDQESVENIEQANKLKFKARQVLLYISTIIVILMIITKCID